jgi:hypothetical protein
MRALAILGGSMVVFVGTLLLGTGPAPGASRSVAAEATAYPAGAAVVGSGSTRTESRAVASFNRIALSSIGNLEVRQGPKESLSITAEDNVLPALLSDVEGGELKLSTRADANLQVTKEVRYLVTVKDLRALTLAGAGRATLIDLRSDALALTLSGSGGMTLTHLEARSLTLALSGQGSVTASGRAARQEISVSGMGTYNARELTSDEAILVLSGTGSIQVSVQRTLDATISGVGDIVYHGSPKVNRRVSGVGQVRPG